MYGYLYPAPLWSPRLSLADLHVSKRHHPFPRITFEIGSLVDVTIGSAYRNPDWFSLWFVFYPLKSPMLFTILYGLLM